MASLYIKDPETAVQLRASPGGLGKTKTEVVRDAVAKVELELATKRGDDWIAWIADYRKDHPLPPATGRRSDKAFFDEMWGEVD